MHVVILVFCQTSSKNHILFMCCQVCISGIQSIVTVIVYRIIRCGTLFPFAGILICDNSIRLLPEFKVLMLYATGIWNLGFSVVYYSVALEIFDTF